MPTDDTVELDATLALILDVGLSAPLPTWQRAEWCEHEHAVDRMKARALAGEGVSVDRQAIARAVAEFAGLNDPTRAETVNLLIDLIQPINRVMQGSRQAFIGAGMVCFGWPSDPHEFLADHLIAAADLGLFDPPGQPPRRSHPQEVPDPHSNEDGPRYTISFESPDDETAIERADRTLSAQPTPARPRTAREQFLFEWEILLDSIVDRITDELLGCGYLEHLG